ncbi:MAG: hemolysin-type calcium binding protein [Candidatus Ozemobacter sibiricus]|jgi:hypothetical protein|uniref:Hemolysin-type calcium binding protein n=1 Tax=Candidatus Ozemobacter sibiricus TaxID=2268124 RepID=A0A367ZVR9_9BACT|nr:MAG: hemolysin-type calcium binding protein [Candidatus Ozemobacter sibiricus]
MAHRVGVHSEMFFQARRTELVVEAFTGRGRKPPTGKTDIEQDLLDLSPLATLGTALDRFRRESPDGARLQITYTVTEVANGLKIGNPRLERDLDFLLRLIARDDEELARLRAQFRELLDLASAGATGAFASAAGGGEGSRVRAASAEGVGAAAESGEADRPALAWTADMEILRELSISLEKVQSRLEIRSAQVKKIDPLVLDLDGNGYDLTEAGEGASFDIDADGRLDRTAWVKGGDALLVLDRNGNGRIDDGRELFGDQNGAANGFLELATFDRTKDGRIDQRDPVFKALQLYRDLNGDGAIQARELASLPELGIASLDLRFIRQLSEIRGNTLILEASFTRTDGTSGKIGDFQFGYRPGAGAPIPKG